jgi:hypothetical protein
MKSFTQSCLNRQNLSNRKQTVLYVHSVIQTTQKGISKTEVQTPFLTGVFKQISEKMDIIVGTAR